MNINQMIVAELKRRRATALASLKAADKALAMFTDGTTGSAPAKAPRRKRRTKAQMEGLRKAQEAPRASIEAKKGASKGDVKGNGASLAEAAG